MRALMTTWLVLGTALSAAAQTAPATTPAGGPGATPPSATTPAPAPAPEADYSYSPEGRRDPFVSLLSRGKEGASRRAGGTPADGLPGLTVADMSVRGVLRTPRGFVALVQGPDNKTYMARPKDRLADGTIKAVTPEGVVVLQDVHDPLSLVKQREIRKLLHGTEEGK